jgi:hypothetical protein
MRYWGILVGKLVAGAGILFGIWEAAYHLYPLPSYYLTSSQGPFLHDLPWTTLMFVYNLLCNAVLVLIVLDQRYRCRSCGRRLRMPVSTGSHAHLLFGPPRTDYICPYGHGTLKVPELQLTGHESADWKANDDMWTELYTLSDKERDKEK